MLKGGFVREIVIEAGKEESGYWRDVWEHRELLGLLAWREISVRYKQTVAGVLWVLIRPFLTIIVFTAIFGAIAGLGKGETAPYPILVAAGMMPWTLFSSCFSAGSGGLLSNSSLISKVYFPRIILPLCYMAVGIVEFVIALLMIVGLMIYYRFSPSWTIGFLPFFVLLCTLAALGPALLLGALNVRFRDIGQVIPFIMQFGMLISPVGYSRAIVSEKWQVLYALNPMVGIIDGFRWSFLGGTYTPWWPAIWLACASTIFFLILGVWYFRKTEKSFADYI